MERMLHLTGRYYQTVPMNQAGYLEERLDLPADQTALVSLHSWDIGCPGGPRVMNDFWVGMGFPQTAQEAYRIMEEAIRPTLDAARAAGVPVCHVQAELIAQRYPEWHSLHLDNPPGPAGQAPPPVLPGHRERIVARSHGQDYDSKSGYAKMGFPEIVKPLPHEPVVHQSGQFDRILRERKIAHLIYVGFATDMCILNAPGGIAPMAGMGYDTILVRDATVGVEFPDWWEERISTRYAIRFFETHFGDTIVVDDFIRNCEELREEHA
jgi:nicotinamidase-related amidase